MYIHVCILREMIYTGISLCDIILKLQAKGHIIFKYSDMEVHITRKVGYLRIENSQ